MNGSNADIDLWAMTCDNALLSTGDNMHIEVPSFAFGHDDTMQLAEFALTKAAGYYGFDPKHIEATVVADTFNNAVAEKGSEGSILHRTIVVNWVALDESRASDEGDEELMQESRLIIDCGFYRRQSWVSTVIHVVTNDETTFEDVIKVWQQTSRMMSNAND